MRLFHYLNKSENSVPILLAATILSMSYPYGFPLCGILALLLGILKVFTGKFKIRINTGLLLFYLCVLAYGFGMIQNCGMIYSHNISDIINIIIYFIFWVLLSDLRKEDYPVLLHNFAKYAVFICFVVSLVSLYKFHQLINGVYIQAFLKDLYYPIGTSLVRDYNMFSLALIAGLVMNSYLLSKVKKTSHIIYFLISFTSIFLSILFAGSRRAWIVATLIALFIGFRALRSLVIRKRSFHKLIKLSFVTINILIFIILMTHLFNIKIEYQNSAPIQRLVYRFETLQMEEVDDSFSSRTTRWKYVADIIDESSTVQIFVGNGFDYLEKFSSEFDSGLKEDYPHNPLLSALLYSGLVGVVLLLALLSWSLYMSFKNYKVIDIHYTFLCLTSSLFIMVSSSTIFSVGLFLPFLLVLISVPTTHAIGRQKNLTILLRH